MCFWLEGMGIAFGESWIFNHNNIVSLQMVLTHLIQRETILKPTTSRYSHSLELLEYYILVTFGFHLFARVLKI